MLLPKTRIVIASRTPYSPDQQAIFHHVFNPLFSASSKTWRFFNKRSLKEIARIAARICKVAPEKPGISRGPKHSTYRGYNPSYYP